MKKFLVIFGSFLLFIISTATMFKLMHWPGAGPLLVIGITFFAMFFIPLFFIQRMIENKSGLSITTNIFGLVSTSMIFMGVLFKMMHWPGAGPLIVFGIMLFSFPTMILYMIFQFKELDRKFSDFWKTVVLAYLVSIFLIFWGTNVTRNVLEAFLRVEDNTLATNKNLANYNTYIMSEIGSKSDSNATCSSAANKIHELSTKTVSDIEEIKSYIIDAVQMGDPSALDNHWNINSKDNYDIPTHILCGEMGKGKALAEELDIYNKSVEEEIANLHFEKQDPSLSELKESIAQVNNEIDYIENNEPWEDRMFDHQTIAATLALLSGLQTEVLNKEFESLRTIQTNMKH